MLSLCMAYESSLSDDAELIERLGGPKELAEKCSRLQHITPQGVSYWKRVGIPPLWRFFLQKTYPRAFRIVSSNASVLKSDLRPTLADCSQATPGTQS